jgi:hypothetical protein
MPRLRRLSSASLAIMIVTIGGVVFAEHGGQNLWQP